MSILQFPKHIVDELPRLLPYLEGYTSDITSPSYTPTSSNFKIPPQGLEHIPEELLYLVPYFEQVDQDLLWLLPYSKDFTTEASSPSHIPVPSTHQRHDHVQYDSSDSEEDNSFADDSSDDSDSCSDSEDEFYDCNPFEIDLGSNTNGHFDRYRLGDDDTDSEMTDPESSLDKNDEVHAAIVSESEDDASFAAVPMKASSAPTPARTVETVQAEQDRRIAPLPRRSITPPQSTATLYLFPTARTTRKNYAELEESDDENASDDEFVPEKSSGSGKRKNKSASRGRRMKTSFDSGSSSGSSSPSPAPTTSSYGSPAPSFYGSPAPSSYDSPSPSNSSSSSSAASSSSRSSAKSKSKPKPKSSGRKSKSGRAPKRASAVKKAAAPKKKQPRINTPRSRRTQVDYDLANDYEVHHDPVVWDENGEAPCVLCDLVLKAGRKADNKRHYRTHCKQFCIAQQTGQRIWVCSEEVDQVLDNYPEYRLPGYSHWGCKGSFCRKDTMVRHIKNGTCAR